MISGSVTSFAVCQYFCLCISFFKSNALDSICLGKFKNKNQRESLFKGEGAKDIFPGKI